MPTTSSAMPSGYPARPASSALITPASLTVAGNAGSEAAQTEKSVTLKEGIAAGGDDYASRQSGKKGAEWARLQALEAPRMGKLERVMSLGRRGEDIPRHEGDVTLDNFGKVSQSVYRGGMPESGAEYEKLKNHYKVTTIIDLRGQETTSPEARRFAEEWAKYYGLRYVHIPMDSHEPPTPEQLEKVQATIKEAESAGGKVYIHCKHGVDRTGAVVAWYEQEVLGKSPKEVWKNMKKHGYNFFHEITRPKQGKFVRGFTFQERLAEKWQSFEEFLRELFNKTKVAVTN